MNTKNLLLKFALFVFLPIIICLWMVYAKGLKAGIDLAGGHTMIFEIRTPEGVADEARDLPQRIIRVLKERIDPRGLLNIQWRPIGSNRIEVRMPASSPASQAARRAYQLALDQLEQGNLRPSDVQRVLRAAPDERAARIAEVARGDAALTDALGAAADAADGVEAARAELLQLQGQLQALPPDAAPEAIADLNAAIAAAENQVKDAQAALALQRSRLYDRNLTQARLEGVLRNYLPPREKALERDPAEIDRRNRLYADGLAELRQSHPTRVEQIDRVAELYTQWANLRQRLEEPADLQRLIAKAGVLEFRIAPVTAGERENQIVLRPEEVRQYRELLAERGPAEVLKRGLPYAWFALNDPSGFEHLIQDDYEGRTYVLLSNDPQLSMLQIPGQTRWRLDQAFPDRDDRGQPAVGFQFNDAGALIFSNLTASNLKRPMAILLDNEVYSAPYIQSAISSRGVITGRFTQDEVLELVRTLDAGSLPGRLDPNPVVQNTFGAGIGEVNKEKGIQAAVWGLIAVGAFMLVYYLLAGLITNAALLFNLILVLGAMSLLDASFTLPGIAGIILTIGIAVDANVLIFERLREEQAKNQSVRMALKNAYERAFSAIFDANLTTLITCLILGWVGTEEVRGFAITLGLGVLFSLFSALLVTRWIFQALLDARLLKKPLGMLKLVGVPNVNWMSKRYFFWGLSAAMIVLGVVSLFWQGNNIWGIEFSAGTKATIAFERDALVAGALPDDDNVRQAFRATAQREGLDKLAATAIVETVFNEADRVEFLRVYDRDNNQEVTLQEWLAVHPGREEVFGLLSGGDNEPLAGAELEALPALTYQISTTETNWNEVRRALGEAFGTSLQTQTRSEFDLLTPRAGEANPLGADLAPSGVTWVTPTLARQANPALALEDYEGGVVMVVQNVEPALTVDEYRRRISDMRLQPDFDDERIDAIDVIGLTQAQDGAYTGFLVFVTPTDASVRATPTAQQGFERAALQWGVQNPLQREEAITVVNFDAEIAGEAAQLAIVAVILSCFAIVLYLWFRFGSAQWGLAAVVCLVHDVLIVLGLVAVSNWLHRTFLGSLLGIDAFKIDLAMVAAILTIIGYSVNDTIVVFDRIRENRGRLAVVTPQVINASVNQTLSRTMLTSGTTLVVILVMYIWGGTGIHAFSFALLAGVLFGTYSSVAIAAPLLLGFREAITAKTTVPDASPTTTATR